MVTNSETKFVMFWFVLVFKIIKTRAVLYLFNLNIYSCTSQMVLLKVTDIVSVSRFNKLPFRRLEKKA